MKGARAGSGAGGRVSGIGKMSYLAAATVHLSGSWSL